jgi:hypothetical protein
MLITGSSHWLSAWIPEPRMSPFPGFQFETTERLGVRQELWCAVVWLIDDMIAMVQANLIES